MHQWGPFDVVFAVMFVACFLIRAPLEYRNKKLAPVESRAGALEKFFLLLVFTASTTLPLLYLFTPWFDFASHAVPAGVGAAGCVLAVVGVALFWKTHRDLGRQFSPTLELREAHQLVCSGIYSRIRHPIAHFGQAYADYQSRTGRLLPLLRR